MLQIKWLIDCHLLFAIREYNLMKQVHNTPWLFTQGHTYRGHPCREGESVRKHKGVFFGALVDKNTGHGRGWGWLGGRV